MTSTTETWDKVHGIRIYQRGDIWYADFRRYQDANHESLGTENREVAEEKLYKRKQELEALENSRESSEWGDPLVEDFAEAWLDWRTDQVSESTWVEDKRTLEKYLIPFLRSSVGKKVRVSDISVRLLERYLRWRTNNGVKASTANRELATISAMLDRAWRWEAVDTNQARRAEYLEEKDPKTEWLEVDEAGRVLKAAKAMEQDSQSRCYPHFHALIATFLLTGGRRSEVFGLEREDVRLDDGYIHIRPNQWRDLKTKQSKRTVPLWPQLEDVLRPYLASRSDDHPLLFPLHYSEEKVKSPMIGKIRSSLDTVQETASLDTRLTTMVFRHTYCATRIQTLEGGAPISLFHVATEMGHKGTDRIADTYGHLQKERKRREEVRYEVPDED